MNKFLKFLSFFTVVALTFVATSAFADNNLASSNSNVFNTVLERMVDTFKNVRAVIFVVGGFGLVGLAFAAIFGKVKWSWLAALAVGLAIVAVAGAVIDYVTQKDVSEVHSYDGNFGDPLY